LISAGGSYSLQGQNYPCVKKMRMFCWLQVMKGVKRNII